MQTTSRDPVSVRPMLSEGSTVSARGMRWLLAALICLSAAVFLKVFAVCVLPLELTFRLNAWFLSLDLASYLDPAPLIRKLAESLTLEGRMGELLTETLSTVTRTAVYQLARAAVRAFSELVKGPVGDFIRVFTAAAGTAALLTEIPTVWSVICGWTYRGGMLNGGRPRGLRGLRILFWIRLSVHYLAFLGFERTIRAAVLPFLGYGPGLAVIAALWTLNRVGSGLRILFDAEVIRSAGLLEKAAPAGRPEGRPSRLVPVLLVLYALFSVACAALYAIPGLALFALYHLALAAGCVCAAVFFRFATVPGRPGPG